MFDYFCNMTARNDWLPPNVFFCNSTMPNEFLDPGFGRVSFTQDGKQSPLMVGWPYLKFTHENPRLPKLLGSLGNNMAKTKNLWTGAGISGIGWRRSSGSDWYLISEITRDYDGLGMSIATAYNILWRSSCKQLGSHLAAGLWLG